MSDLLGPPAYHQPFTRYGLYRLRNGYILVGHDDVSKEFCLLRINPNPENGEVELSTGDVRYSSDVYENMMGNISKKEQFQKITDAVGVVGFLRFDNDLTAWYIVMIKESKCVGRLGHHEVHTIVRTHLEPLLAEGQPKIDTTNNTMFQEFQKYNLLHNGFYFSYTYELQYTVQRNASELVRARQTSFKSKPKIVVEPTDESNDTISFTSKRSEPPGVDELLQHDPLFCEGDEHHPFVWNYRHMKPFLRTKKYRHWCLPLIYGSFEVVRVGSMGGYSDLPPMLRRPQPSFSLALICRRSRFFAGTRFRKRGVDAFGNTANEVESEQIVIDDASRHFRRGNITSFVQLRGSVPVFWSQEIIAMNPKPPVKFHRPDPTAVATRMHTAKLIRRYGPPIWFVNLMRAQPNNKISGDSEIELSKQFYNAVEMVKGDLPSGVSLEYVHYDMKNRQREENDIFKSVTRLVKRVNSHVNFYHSSLAGCSDAKPQRLQTGILRTNCIDCLDRTNVLQFYAGVDALASQLQALKLLPDDANLGRGEEVAKILSGLYDRAGDILSHQYAGSQAHKKYAVLAPQPNQSPFRAGIDAWISLNRTFTTTFTDATKQVVYNVLLGGADEDVSNRKVVRKYMGEPESEIDMFIHSGQFDSLVGAPYGYGCEWWRDSLTVFAKNFTLLLNLPDDYNIQDRLRVSDANNVDDQILSPKKPPRTVPRVAPSLSRTRLHISCADDSDDAILGSDQGGGKTEIPSWIWILLKPEEAFPEPPPRRNLRDDDEWFDQIYDVGKLSVFPDSGANEDSADIQEAEVNAEPFNQNESAGREASRQRGNSSLWIHKMLSMDPATSLRAVDTARSRWILKSGDPCHIGAIEGKFMLDDNDYYESLKVSEENKMVYKKFTDMKLLSKKKLKTKDKQLKKKRTKSSRDSKEGSLHGGSVSGSVSFARNRRPSFASNISDSRDPRLDYPMRTTMKITTPPRPSQFQSPAPSTTIPSASGIQSTTGYRLSIGPYKDRRPSIETSAGNADRPFAEATERSSGDIATMHGLPSLPSREFSSFNFEPSPRTMSHVEHVKMSANVVESDRFFLPVRRKQNSDVADGEPGSPGRGLARVQSLSQLHQEGSASTSPPKKKVSGGLLHSFSSGLLTTFGGRHLENVDFALTDAENRIVQQSPSPERPMNVRESDASIGLLSPNMLPRRYIGASMDRLSSATYAIRIPKQVLPPPFDPAKIPGIEIRYDSFKDIPPKVQTKLAKVAREALTFAQKWLVALQESEFNPSVHGSFENLQGHLQQRDLHRGISEESAIREQYNKELDRNVSPVASFRRGVPSTASVASLSQSRFPNNGRNFSRSKGQTDPKQPSLDMRIVLRQCDVCGAFLICCNTYSAPEVSLCEFHAEKFQRAAEFYASEIPRPYRSRIAVLPASTPMTTGVSYPNFPMHEKTTRSRYSVISERDRLTPPIESSSVVGSKSFSSLEGLGSLESGLYLDKSGVRDISGRDFSTTAFRERSLDGSQARGSANEDWFNEEASVQGGPNAAELFDFAPDDPWSRWQEHTLTSGELECLRAAGLSWALNEIPRVTIGTFSVLTFFVVKFHIQSTNFVLM